MAQITHEQWRDQHQSSRYPFADTSTLITTDGVELARDTFLDAQLYPIGGEERMYLSSVVAEADKITLYVGTLDQPQLASGEFDVLNPPDNVRFEDTHGRAAGVIVSESLRLARFQSWEPGTHTFDRSASEFAASVCVPTPEIGLRGFITEAGDICTGDVWIVGENGVLITEDTEAAAAGQRVIRMDIVGDPLFRRALCEGTADSPLGPVDLFAPLKLLQTINGCEPDEYGDFKITGGSNDAVDSILRIYPSPEGVHFEAVGAAAVDPLS